MSEIAITDSTARIKGKNILLDGNVSMTNAYITDLEALSINAVEGDITRLITDHLEADTITSDKLVASLAMIDKLFATSALIDRLTSKSAFISDIQAMNISADRITSGTLNSNIVNAISLNVSQLTGNITNFIQSYWNSINERVAVNASGISMLGSDAWRETIANANGFDLYGGSGASEKAGAIGYFKPHINIASPEENIMSGDHEGARHIIGMAANYGYDLMLGVGSPTNPNAYSRAIEIDGITADIHVFKSVYPDAQSDDGFTLNHSLHRGFWATHLENAQNFRNRLSLGRRHVWLESAERLYFYTRSGVNVMSMHSNVDVYTNLSLHGNSLLNESDERLKRDISTPEINPIEIIREWNFVGYNWKDHDKDGRNGRQLGLIAQETPYLAQYNAEEDVWNIDSTKQTMIVSYALQQHIKSTNERIDELERKTDDRIARLEREIKELKGAK